MSSELCSLLLPTILCSATLSFHAFFALLFVAAISSYWLVPGGLAWALSSNKNTISGPSGFPILGLVFSFTGALTHRVLSKLANGLKAKSLMSFSVGVIRFIISSNPDTAKEILNSSAFADCPVKKSVYELLLHRTMGFAPFGEYWRNLRRISATHLFAPRRIAATGEFRLNIGLNMVNQIKGLMESNNAVEVREILHFGSLNNVMKTVFRKSYDFGKSGDANDFEVEELVKKGYELLGMLLLDSKKILQFSLYRLIFYNSEIRMKLLSTFIKFSM
ncbi:putative ferruginol synthase [Lupinus albus]|uniref:Putative ferruginol synthase n=1 Tax=Lupinus albus TaxID=3870 RepID=A0A6A4NPG9_LUPAL|nr:putative ferruginol synthase [Lupinus albus]